MKHQRIVIRLVSLAALVLAASALARDPAPVTVSQPEVRPAVERIELTGSAKSRLAEFTVRHETVEAPHVDDVEIRVFKQYDDDESAFVANLEGQRSGSCGAGADVLGSQKMVAMSRFVWVDEALCNGYALLGARQWESISNP